MDIYLIRHGETDYNKARRLQGVTDIPLNAYGIELAEKTAEGLKNVHFDRIYTSPLIRARKTAEIIRGDRKIEIIPTEGLREISFGEYEGLVHMGEERNIPDPDFHYFFDAPERYVTPPGGESLMHLRERTTAFVKKIMNDEANEGLTFLMASHGAAIRAILSGLQNLPVAQFWSGPVHKNCGVTKIHSEHGRFEIVFENRIYYQLEEKA